MGAGGNALTGTGALAVVGAATPTGDAVVAVVTGAGGGGFAMGSATTGAFCPEAPNEPSSAGVPLRPCSQKTSPMMKPKATLSPNEAMISVFELAVLIRSRRTEMDG